MGEEKGKLACGGMPAGGNEPTTPGYKDMCAYCALCDVLGDMMIAFLNYIFFFSSHAICTYTYRGGFVTIMAIDSTNV